MTFSPAETVLLVALVLTSGVVAATWRELRRQNRYRAEFARILTETAAALEGIDRTVRDFDQRGNAVLRALGTRIEQAREVLGDIDRRGCRASLPAALNGGRAAGNAMQER